MGRRRTVVNAHQLATARRWVIAPRAVPVLHAQRYAVVAARSKARRTQMALTQHASSPHKRPPTYDLSVDCSEALMKTTLSRALKIL